MPSRVIRAEINSSDSLSRVSMEADLTFRALLVAVDDYGRFDGRLAVLKATLFPTREISPKKLEGWLAELDAEGCIQRYEVDGRPYVALTGWERHRGKGRRADESRFPSPPERSQSNPRISGKSDDEHVNPPVGRWTRDEEREARDERRARADARDSLAWAAMEEAFARHGKRDLRGTEPRLKAIRGRLSEGFEPEDFRRAVDGYQSMHAGRNGSGDFDPARYFTPETILQPSKFSKYVEQARASPGRKAWERDPDQPLPPRMYS